MKRIFLPLSIFAMTFLGACKPRSFNLDQSDVKGEQYEARALDKKAPKKIIVKLSERNGTLYFLSFDVNLRDPKLLVKDGPQSFGKFTLYKNLEGQVTQESGSVNISHETLWGEDNEEVGGELRLRFETSIAGKFSLLFGGNTGKYVGYDEAKGKSIEIHSTNEWRISEEPRENFRDKESNTLKLEAGYYENAPGEEPVKFPYQSPEHYTVKQVINKFGSRLSESEKTALKNYSNATQEDFAEYIQAEPEIYKIHSRLVGLDLLNDFKKVNESHGAKVDVQPASSSEFAVERASNGSITSVNGVSIKATVAVLLHALGFEFTKTEFKSATKDTSIAKFNEVFEELKYGRDFLKKYSTKEKLYEKFREKDK